MSNVHECLSTDRSGQLDLDLEKINGRRAFDELRRHRTLRNSQI
jgi:hypothetical protein